MRDNDDATSSDEVIVTINEPPIANVGPDLRINPGEPVKLNGSESSDNDGSTMTYEWKENGNTISNEVSVTLLILAAGIHSFTLEVTDEIGSKHIDTVNVEVNALPVANTGPDQTVTVTKPLTLNGINSTDSDGTITNYIWRSGNQVLSTDMSFTTTSYLIIGVYELTLTTTDKHGVSTNDSVLVTVIPLAEPIANAGPDQTSDVGESVTFNGTSSTDSDGSITDYIWSEGSIELGSGANFSLSFSTPGDHLLTLTVIDDDQLTASDDILVSVNVSPVANAGTNQTITTDESVTLDGSNSIDSDGTITEYVWSESDNPLSSDMAFTKTDFAIGSHLITLTVRDNNGTAASSTVTITNPPVARPLNDTGIVWGSNYPKGDNTTCIGETISQQDCSSDHDTLFNDDSDGLAGFSFTKLDSNGNPLKASATEWECVLDNVTGLIWEVKTDKDTPDLRDKDWAYMNTSNMNGSDPRDWLHSGSSCLIDQQQETDINCHIERYRDEVNAQGLCGANNWRLPKRNELLSIVDYNKVYPAPFIDTNYFPSTQKRTYWTESASALYPDKASQITNGRSTALERHYGRSVRLVLDEQ